MISSERDLIFSIRKLVSSRQEIPEHIHGIGDDCAVYRISSGRYGLFSTDMSVENVHFDPAYCTWHDTGYRSMTANISDIYAMGGRPIMAFISAGIPSQTEEKNVMEIYEGIINCANRYGVTIAGGDTVSSEKLILGISIYGETGSPVMRKGAEPGDYIYLTGNTGGSLLGYELLNAKAETSSYPESVIKHLRPEPYGPGIDELVTFYSPTAMIDISDGLLSDLDQVCTESGCGFELYQEKIPVPAEVASYCLSSGSDTLDYTLRSGEEYELLFTSKKHETGYNNISLIGKIVSGGKSIIINNSSIPADTKGFDHFNRKG